MARPSVITQSVINRLEEAFSLGCTDSESCLYANIAPATLYNYQEKNKEFLERKEVLKQTPILIARSTVIKELKNDPALALKFLERKKKDEFSPNSVSSLSFVANQHLHEIGKKYEID